MITKTFTLTGIDEVIERWKTLLDCRTYRSHCHDVTEVEIAYYRASDQTTALVFTRHEAYRHQRDRVRPGDRRELFSPTAEHHRHVETQQECHVRGAVVVDVDEIHNHLERSGNVNANTVR